MCVCMYVQRRSILSLSLSLSCALPLASIPLDHRKVVVTKPSPSPRSDATQAVIHQTKPNKQWRPTIVSPLASTSPSAQFNSIDYQIPDADKDAEGGRSLARSFIRSS
ncbi:hypothetical protein HDK64DRAFT_149115 [Phyllosticta capitalensis]